MLSAGGRGSFLEKSLKIRVSNFVCCSFTAYYVFEIVLITDNFRVKMPRYSSLLGGAVGHVW
jgi:hypothetical protein